MLCLQTTQQLIRLGGAPLKVIGPKPIGDITEKLFGSEGVFATDLTARTQNKGSQEVWVERGGTLPRPWPEPKITEVEPGFIYEGEGWTLSSCRAPHAQPHLTCMAFKVESSGKSIVYTGDSALCPEVEELANGADLLLHWCYRLSSDEINAFIRKMSPDPIEIGALAERCQVGQLLVTHLRTSMDTDEAREQILAEMQREFSGGSAIAEDLMEIQL